MQGSGASWPGLQNLGAGPAPEMLEQRREPRLSWNGQRIGGPRVLRPGCMFDSAGESGGIQAPGACGPGLQGAWGPGPQGLGPGPGAFSTKTTQITIFRKPPGGSLAKAWVSAETAASEVGTWRETKPGYPPYPPPPTRSAFWGVFTLSAFGNHPTRPPRSAD